MDPRQLRESTRAEHEATEALMPLANPTLDRATYERTLEILFDLITSWEGWVLSRAPRELGTMLTARRRSHLLAADLQALGRSAPFSRSVEVDWGAVVNGAGRDNQDHPPKPALLGAIYVMEGSTLGGQYLARHVETVFGFTPGHGNAYFRGHGERTGLLWREILGEIGTIPDTEASTTIEAARRTFRAFGQVLQLGYAVEARS